MGLFDFASNIGKKVFGIGDADAAEQVKTEIEAFNPGVSNLDVSMDGETCTLTGECESAEAKAKTVLMAGNVMGVGEVVADGLSAPEKKSYKTLIRSFQGKRSLFLKHSGKGYSSTPNSPFTGYFFTQNNLQTSSKSL